MYLIFCELVFNTGGDGSVVTECSNVFWELSEYEDIGINAELGPNSNFPKSAANSIIFI